MTDLKWTLKRFKVKDLQDYPKNPRRLTKAQHAKLRESITKFGLIDKPICTSSGLIIGGHARKKVLQSLGITEVDCYTPSRELSDQEIAELNIRLNKNSGEFDFDILANEFEVADLVNWGFESRELFDNLTNDTINGNYEQEETQRCDHCGQAIRAKRGKGAREKKNRSST